jgi:hypothetical protein
MKLTGIKALVYSDSLDCAAIIEGNGTLTTVADTFYFVFARGAGSDLPVEDSFFKSPHTTQITLVTGDKVYPIERNRFCKTSADISFEQGTVDVSDDCDVGATILDGNVQISGSLAGLFRYDDKTQNFDEVTDEFVNKFLNIISDDGAGTYELKPRNDQTMYLLVLLNSGAKAGQTENWVICPIVIASMSMSLGNTDAQNKDLSWNKGEGHAVIYKVPKTA